VNELQRGMDLPGPRSGGLPIPLARVTSNGGTPISYHGNICAPKHIGFNNYKHATAHLSQRGLLGAAAIEWRRSSKFSEQASAQGKPSVRVVVTCVGEVSLSLNHLRRFLSPFFQEVSENLFCICHGLIPSSLLIFILLQVVPSIDNRNYARKDEGRKVQLASQPGEPMLQLIAAWDSLSSRLPSSSGVDADVLVKAMKILLTYAPPEGATHALSATFARRA